MKPKQETVVVHNHFQVINEGSKSDPDSKKEAAAELELKLPPGLTVKFKGPIQFIIMAVVVVALIGTLFYSIFKPTEQAQFKITFSLKDGQSYFAAVSKKQNNAPFTFAEASGDVYYIFEVEGAEVYKITFQRISEPDIGRITDVTNDYRTGTFRSIDLGVTYLVAFETDQGVFYMRLLVKDIFSEPNLNAPFGG